MPPGSNRIIKRGFRCVGREGGATARLGFDKSLDVRGVVETLVVDVRVVCIRRRRLIGSSLCTLVGLCNVQVIASQQYRYGRADDNSSVSRFPFSMYTSSKSIEPARPLIVQLKVPSL